MTPPVPRFPEGVPTPAQKTAMEAAIGCGMAFACSRDGVRGCVQCRRCGRLFWAVVDASAYARAPWGCGCGGTRS